MSHFDFEIDDPNLRLRVRPIGSPRIDWEPGRIHLVSHDLYVEAMKMTNGRTQPYAGIVTLGMSPLFQVGACREGVLDAAPDRTARFFRSDSSPDPGFGSSPGADGPDPLALGPRMPWLGSDGAPELGLTGMMPFEEGLIDRYTRMPFGTGGRYDLDVASGRFEPVTPGTGRYRKGHFHERAGLTVLDDALLDAEGRPIAPVAGLISTRRFRDPRTGRTTVLTQIDLYRLGLSGLWPSNGLLYAGRSDSPPEAPSGILLVNAGELVDPLTVASESPVYIRGDYNVVDRKGAAIFADTVHVLSDNWDLIESTGSGSCECPPAESPPADAPSPARSTTIVASLVSGKRSPVPEGAERGFWDLVRLHEDWSGCELHIRGACMSLYRCRSEPPAGGDAGASEFRPTLRLEFDPENLHIDRLPPFTPLAVWLREFPASVAPAGGEGTPDD